MEALPGNFNLFRGLEKTPQRKQNEVPRLTRQRGRNVHFQGSHRVSSKSHLRERMFRKKCIRPEQRVLKRKKAVEMTGDRSRRAGSHIVLMGMNNEKL